MDPRWIRGLCGWMGLIRVREEVTKIWSPKLDTLITAKQLRQMKYTQAATREVVRFHPSVSLLLHIATVDFPLTENYKIPRSSIVFPSAYKSSFQGFIESE